MQLPGVEAARFRPAPQVAWQVIDGEAVIVDLASGVTIGLNASGTLIWQQLMQRDASEVAAAIAEAFDVDAAAAADDVDAFVHMLRDRNLVVEGGAE